jgi:hypothetical protein
MVWGSDGWASLAGSSSQTPINTFGLVQNFNASSGSHYLVDGLDCDNNNANKAWSVTLVDPYTLRFEVRQGDVWTGPDSPSVERSEIEFNQFYNEGVFLNWEAIITVAPGSPVTGGFWALCQLHATTNVSPTFATFSIQIEPGTDKLQLVLTEPAQSGNNYAYTSPSAIPRGTPMNLKARVKMGPTGSGTAFVTWDGNTILNFTGKVGATASQYYWKCGSYRGTTAPTTVTDFNHIHIYTG